jgi:5-oxopent-3-ene-1,2,5-tricarboxylate decarboxylase / 2-hydroxyhepta-2,4-diene-1,7-dioate isomerase
MRQVRLIHDGQPRSGQLVSDEIVLADGSRVAVDDARFLAPVTPSKIIAVHLTYQSRLDEYAAQAPAYPSYFMKPPSALTGHRCPVRRPNGTRFLNYEGELAVVVGTRMQGVKPSRVPDYVFGFAPANDIGLHDFRHADRGSMLRVKGQDGFLPLGPAVVTKDEWTPDDGYTLTTTLNGVVVQRSDQSDLLFDYRYQLADLCRLITLEPGDVILTGTPANSRPMEPGDTVSVEVSGLGRLENPIEAWEVDLSGPGETPRVSANTLHVALAIPEPEAELQARAELER